jgi:hypothetical protein
MNLRLIGAGAGVVFMGGVFAVIMIDRSVNYQTVQARVDAVTSTCHLEKKGFKSREWTDDRPCDQIEDAKANDPQYASFHIKRSTTAQVVYVSPADGQEHQGEVHHTTTDDEAPFGGAKEGGMMPILAHSSKATRIQTLY